MAMVVLTPPLSPLAAVLFIGAQVDVVVKDEGAFAAVATEVVEE